MKYLILGVNGMAGHMIAQYLTEQGNDVIGFARVKSQICPTIIGDALNREEVDETLQSSTYDCVVNAIGVLNNFVDKNLSEGIYLNSVFPHYVAKQLKDTSAKFIHISTDCVFEGTRGNYTVQDYPDATSYYGRSKALGEVQYGKNLTLRTSIVGPELKQSGIGLFHWFMSQSGTVNGYDKVFWSGVTTLQLAKTIEEDQQKNRIGLYHLVNNQQISKYDLLQYFNRYCRTYPIEIKRDSSVISDKTLLNTEKMDFIVPSYQQMIKDMADWIVEHPKLYKQYQGV